MSEHHDESSPRVPSKDSRAKGEELGRDDRRLLCETQIDLTVEAEGKRLASMSAVDEEGNQLEVTIMVEDKHGRACCWDAAARRWYRCRR